MSCEHPLGESSGMNSLGRSKTSSGKNAETNSCGLLSFAKLPELRASQGGTEATDTPVFGTLLFPPRPQRVPTGGLWAVKILIQMHSNHTHSHLHPSPPAQRSPVAAGPVGTALSAAAGALKEKKTPRKAPGCASLCAGRVLS